MRQDGTCTAPCCPHMEALSVRRRPRSHGPTPRAHGRLKWRAGTVQPPRFATRQRYVGARREWVVKRPITTGCHRWWEAKTCTQHIGTGLMGLPQPTDPARVQGAGGEHTVLATISDFGDPVLTWLRQHQRGYIFTRRRQRRTRFIDRGRPRARSIACTCPSV